MEYLVSFLTFFIAYFGFNFLINSLRKNSKNRKSAKEILRSSLTISILYILVIFVLKKIS